MQQATGVGQSRIWVPPSRRAQVIGSIAILAVAAFWGLLVPFLNGQIEGSNPFKAGRPYDTDGALITPADGWALGSSVAGVFTLLEKSGVSLGITAPTESSGSPEEQLQALSGALSADASTTWLIGEPEPFATDGGAAAARSVSTADGQVDVAYVVDDGTLSMTFGVRTDPDTWAAIEAEVDQMVRSSVITGLPAGEVAP